MELKLTRLNELRAESPADPVIDGLLDDGLVVIAARERKGKTFLGIHMAAHIVSGLDWNKGAVRQGSVVYCNAEGVSFFPFRVTTALDWIGAPADKAPFFMLEGGGDLVTRDGKRSEFVDKLYKEILAIEQEAPPTRMIVFDTLNRYMPGGDENDQKEAGGLIDGCMFLRNELDSHPTIVLMHHLSKEGKVRGSTVITGAADQVLVCKHEGELMDSPILWTTSGEKGMGKRKDRDAVSQWFRFRKVPLSIGDGLPEHELDFDKGVPHLVRVWEPIEGTGPDYDYRPVLRPDGPERTLVMEPCLPPDDVEEVESPVCTAVMDIIASDGSAGITHIMRKADIAQKTAYKAVDSLVKAGKIVQDAVTKRYSVVNDSANPFEEV